MPTDSDATVAQGGPVHGFRFVEPDRGGCRIPRRSQSPERMASILRQAASWSGVSPRKFDPTQPRDPRTGKWIDGMPDAIVDIAVKVAGGTVNVRGGNGNATLATGDRSATLTPREVEKFRIATIHAQYGMDEHVDGYGLYAVRRFEPGDNRSLLLVGLRPTGKLVTETGTPVASLDVAPEDEEVYNAEFDLFIGGHGDDLDATPSIRVSLKDVDQSNRKGIYQVLESVAAARRVATGSGPVDVYSPRPGVVGLRVKRDEGAPAEVLLNARDFQRLRAALSATYDSDDPTSTTVEASIGRLEVSYDGPGGSQTISSPDGWTVVLSGDDEIADFLDALDANGPAGVVRQGSTAVGSLAVDGWRRDHRDAGELHSGAMVALVPTPEDAARLAVEGGLPADELHCTLMFLGDASAFSRQDRLRITVTAWDAIEYLTSVEADAFAVSAFNPGGPEPCIVLGLGGEELSGAHAAVVGALSEAMPGLPEPRRPWAPHVTLAYTDDLSLPARYADRVGPVTFDRLRIAFGGHVVDILLAPEPDDGYGGLGEDYLSAEASELLARVLDTFDGERLAGKDVTPGGEQLKHYWTKDPEGLAKWVGHPKQWTALYHHLVKFMPPEKAKATASAWFHLVLGYWPGHQAGSNPVGPG